MTPEMKEETQAVPTQIHPPTNGTGQGSDAGGVPDKDAIRAEWAEMKVGFHNLLPQIPSDAWRRKSKSTRWTVAELCAHIVHDIEGVPMFVDHCRRGKDLLNLPQIITDPINLIVTKAIAWRATPESLAQKFDEKYEKAMATLDEIRFDEWQRGANFFGEGYWTIEFIFHNSPRHFQEHAAQIRETWES